MDPLQIPEAGDKPVTYCQEGVIDCSSVDASKVTEASLDGVVANVSSTAIKSRNTRPKAYKWPTVVSTTPLREDFIVEPVTGKCHPHFLTTARPIQLDESIEFKAPVNIVKRQISSIYRHTKGSQKPKILTPYSLAKDKNLLIECKRGGQTTTFHKTMQIDMEKLSTHLDLKQKGTGVITINSDIKSFDKITVKGVLRTISYSWIEILQLCQVPIDEEVCFVDGPTEYKHTDLTEVVGVYADRCNMHKNLTVQISSTMESVKSDPKPKLSHCSLIKAINKNVGHWEQIKEHDTDRCSGKNVQVIGSRSLPVITETLGASGSKIRFATYDLDSGDVTKTSPKYCSEALTLVAPYLKKQDINQGPCEIGQMLEVGIIIGSPHDTNENIFPHKSAKKCSPTKNQSSEKQEIVNPMCGNKSNESMEYLKKSTAVGESNGVREIEIEIECIKMDSTRSFTKTQPCHLSNVPERNQKKKVIETVGLLTIRSNVSEFKMIKLKGVLWYISLNWLEILRLCGIPVDKKCFYVRGPGGPNSFVTEVVGDYARRTSNVDLAVRVFNMRGTPTTRLAPTRTESSIISNLTKSIDKYGEKFHVPENMIPRPQHIFFDEHSSGSSFADFDKSDAPVHLIYPAVDRACNTCPVESTIVIEENVLDTSVGSPNSDTDPVFNETEVVKVITDAGPSKSALPDEEQLMESTLDFRELDPLDASPPQLNNLLAPVSLGIGTGSPLGEAAQPHHVVSVAETIKNVYEIDPIFDIPIGPDGKRKYKCKYCPKICENSKKRGYCEVSCQSKFAVFRCHNCPATFKYKSNLYRHTKDSSCQRRMQLILPIFKIGDHSIKQIVGLRIEMGRTLYQVEIEGDEQLEDPWMTEQDLKHCSPLIDEFKKFVFQPCKRRRRK